MTRIVGEVARIWRYPIKSTRGEALKRSAVDRRGIEGDRLYAVRDGQGKLGSGKNTRRFRRMDGLLRLGSRYLGDAVDPLLLDPEDRPVANAVEFLRRYFGDEELDLVPEADVPHLDQLALSFVTTATIDWLRATLPDTPIDERRFRVNVLVRTPLGTRPFIEDEWLGFNGLIGPGLHVSFVRSSERCTMVNDAQQDLPYSPKVLRTITQLHGNKLDALAVVEQPGSIEVGQLISIIGETSPSTLDDSPSHPGAREAAYSGARPSSTDPANVPQLSPVDMTEGLAPPDVLERFDRIRRVTACPFAPEAQLRAAPALPESGSLVEFLAGVVDALAEFVRESASAELDGYVLELRDPAWGSTVDSLARTVRDIVGYLHEHDPDDGSSAQQHIGDGGWRFRFAGGVLFVVAFAPCYEPSNPRWTEGMPSTFLFLQPHYSLTRAHGSGEYDRQVRHTVIRDAFERAGRPYDRLIVDSPLDALKFVKPAFLGDPPVRWWEIGGRAGQELP